ncbi:MAG TPA: response regulator transcription factor [Pseudolabrys sp.]|nr:response regulator transcription factor [Pseudolabrys sp.]
MTAALNVSTDVRLRVALLAPNSLRRQVLTKVLLDAGYILVDTEDSADLVLADGDYDPVEKRPAVILGDGDWRASGSLPRDASAQQIDAALRAVAAGLIVRSPLAKGPGFVPLDEGDIHELLTPRELDVLGAIMDGLTNKLIARQLDISLHTVKFHVESVFRKLGVRTRAEAVAKALESNHFKVFKL